MLCYGIFINCGLFPFIAWILSGRKLYETRPRDVFRQLIGRRVFLIQTGRGRPMIMGSAIIASAETVQFSARELRRRAMITGTPYDIKPDGQKVFYRLSDVRQLPVPVPLPGARENHGRSWTSWPAQTEMED